MIRETGGRVEGSVQQVGNRLHSQNTQWEVGDGAKTLFFLAKKPRNADGLLVFVGGALKRPADRGTAYDYTLSDNRVTFAVAPGAAVNIAFHVAS